jgi:hypothetical protein
MAEACAASLGLAGADVTICEHPFAAPYPGQDARLQDVALSLRSTRPAPVPSESTALALVANAPPGLPDPESDVRTARQEQAREARERAPSEQSADDVEDEARVERMGVLSIPPPRPQRFRYAGLVVLVAAAYCAWLYLLERM